MRGEAPLFLHVIVDLHWSLAVSDSATSEPRTEPHTDLGTKALNEPRTKARSEAFAAPASAPALSPVKALILAGAALATALLLSGCAVFGEPITRTGQGPTPAAAAAGQPGAAAAAAADANSAPAADPFARLVGEAEHREGFFDTWVTKDGKLYLSVPASRLGADFLMEYKVARGIGTAGLYGGTMLSVFEADVVAFEERSGQLFLVKRPHRYRAEAGTPQAAAVDLSFTPSVVEVARIEATRNEGSDQAEHLIEVTNWFVGDLAGVSQQLRGLTSTGAGPGPAPAFDRSRSALDRVAAFPKNVNIRTLLTYRAPQPVSSTAISDPRFISIEIHHTLAELPEVPMTPRLADERMGFFVTAHKDFTEDEDTHFVRYVNRWRLECAGAPGPDGLCDPVKPIVYYLDHTIPEAYRRWFIEGIDAWQSAFAEAGFRNAIRGEMLPEGADPDDIRFPTLRWNTSESAGYSAIGPSTVDPRTGEILDANQLYEAQMILGFRSGWRNLVDPQTAFELAVGAIDPSDHAHMAGVLSDQGLFLRSILSARGEIGASDPLPEEYLGEAIRWVVMHEVGHTLGLRHNFRSSMDTPFDRLHDRDFARANGLVSSVMDYHAPNVAPEGEPQGYFYSPTVGSADRWKIAFGYTADPARAESLARLAETTGRTYGTDEDASGAGAMDPTVNTYDLSADPLAWGRERTQMITELWTRLPETVLEDNTRYTDLTQAYTALVGQYMQALAPAVKFIGGEFVNRTRVGDEADRGPFIPVSRAVQQDALAFLVERGFSEQAFQLDPATVARFGAERWSHWGLTNTYNGRIDFPFHERVSGLQTNLLSQLVSPLRLARIRDAELRYGSDAVLGIPELFQALTRAIWSEVGAAGAPVVSGSGSVNSVRRDLQRSYLTAMSALVTEPQPRTPADARALARRELRTLDGRIATHLQRTTLDAYTRAHLEEVRAWIAKTMDAGIQATR